MKVLIVGSGGREHAIAWSVSQSKRVDKIYCAPGNGGIAEIAECVNITAMEFDKLAAFAKENEIDLKCKFSGCVESRWSGTWKRCIDLSKSAGSRGRCYLINVR